MGEFRNRMEELRREMLAQEGIEELFFDYPGNKWRVVDSELYRMIHDMPKIGLLHTHSGSTFDLDFALSKALSLPETRIYMSKDGKREYGYLMYLPQMDSETRMLQGWKTVDETASEVGDVKAFLTGLYTVGVCPENTIEENWHRFEKIFALTYSLYCYLPVFEPLYLYSCRQMIAEGITRLDYRTLLFDVFDSEGRRLTDEEKVRKLIDLTSEVKKTCPAFDLKIIYCGVKSMSREMILQTIDTARNLMKVFPETVIGYDLVGEETLSNQLAPNKELLEGLDIPLMLHAGEHASREDRNVETAVELNAERIGHGYNLHQLSDKVLEELRNRQTVIEVCPISNQVLGYCRDLREHPAREYIRQGLNVVISSDDHALFGTNYLTDDMFIAYLAWGEGRPDSFSCGR